MSDDPEHITIIAREFTSAALEFHRGKMAERGYRLEGTIKQRAFQLIEGLEPPSDMFDGALMYSVTFVKRDAE